MIQKSKRDELRSLLAEIDCIDDMDELAYVESLIAKCEERLKADDKPKASRADKIRAASAIAQKKAFRDSQDIGPAPEGLVDEDRRAKSDESLLYHLTNYYPETFPLEFGEDQKLFIADIEETLNHGGMKAVAWPRGGGKTAILIRAVLWAVMTRRRRFVCLFASTSPEATELMQKTKVILMTSFRLHQDYGKELHCLISLGGRSTLCAGQHIGGKKTGVKWDNRSIASGSIEGALDEFVILCRSIGGSMRGMSHITVDEKTIRPDALILDDPVTRRVAESKPRTRKLLETINGDMLNLAGTNRVVAAFAALNIIVDGDPSSQLIDRKISPHWRGMKSPFVKQFPTETAMALWKKWESIYLDELDADDIKHAESNQFVRDHYDALHDGAEMFWEHSYDKDSQVSSLHNAMILKNKDEDAFAAEMQLSPNTGGAETGSDLFDLQSDEIARRIRPYKRGVMPSGAEIVTAFIDIQKEFLSYMVMAFSMQGRGYVIDYGSFPDQRKPYYSKQDIANSFEDEFGPMPLADHITQGLDILTDDLLSREFIEDGKRVYSIEKLGVDNRWALVAPDVRAFALESRHRSRLVPMIGHFVGAKTRPWQRISAEKSRRTRGVGVAYKDAPKGTRGIPELHHDTNMHKSNLASGLTVPITSQTAITVFEDTPQNLQMLGDHCEAEQPFIEESKDGAKHVIWRAVQKPCNNELFDGMVGCMALAGTLGVFAKTKRSNTGQSDTTKTKRKRRAYSMNLDLH